jgi:hypothetical protein
VNIFERNFIFHNNGGAGTGQASYGNSAGGMVTGWGDVVRDNVIMDQGGGWCVQISHTSNAVTFTNNTILNCDRGGIVIDNPGLYQGGVDDYTTVTNNIIANTAMAPGGQGTGGVYLIGGSPSCGPHDVLEDNLMYGNTGGNVTNDTGCANAFRGTLGGTNATTFVNYTGTATGDYHLRAGSPAIGAGTTACALSSCVSLVDVEAHPMSSPPPIGAYE